ncbi:MAG: hypothetical protein L6Q59_04535 [Ignavibacteriaceae bacterium]|nr:hypothetical protein [Ignavibacteriaceae bacterium]
MAVEYAKVLNHLNIEYTCVGRSEESCASFLEKTGHIAIPGGLNKFLDAKVEEFTEVIITVNMEQLFSVSKSTIEAGYKKLLVEKPGGLNFGEISELNQIAEDYNAKVYIAYNRRFYTSVLKAKELIEEDGGILSFHFEFTEWSHVIEKLEKPDIVKQNWFLGNSTHVVDLAFFLGGIPVKMESFKSRELPWHKNGSVFTGAGITDKGALFSYHANWESAGRWGVEVMTNRRKLILRPLEQLYVQYLGKLELIKCEIDDTFDKSFKPGLYTQTLSFLFQDKQGLFNLDQQLYNFELYKQIIK